MDEDADLSRAVRRALAESPARVQRLEHRGQVVWIKRAERLGPLRRLQKGNAAAALAAERTALHSLAALGAPVPPILAEGPDFFSVPDCGPTLDALLRSDTAAPPARNPPLARPAREPAFRAAGAAPAFRAAGAALAGLHARHLSHGRPSLKDICWDGERITFLDLERHAAHRNTARGHVRDLVMFVFSGIVVGRGMTPDLAAAIDSYRANDPGGIWVAAQSWCARMRWVDWATRPVQWRREGKAREFKAIPQTLAAFAAR